MLSGDFWSPWRPRQVRSYLLSFAVSKIHLDLPRTRLRDHCNRTDGTETDPIMHKDVRFIIAQ